MMSPACRQREAGKGDDDGADDGDGLCGARTRVHVPESEAPAKVPFAEIGAVPELPAELDIPGAAVTAALGVGGAASAAMLINLQEAPDGGEEEVPLPAAKRYKTDGAGGGHTRNSSSDGNTAIPTGLEAVAGIPTEPGTTAEIWKITFPSISEDNKGRRNDYYGRRNDMEGWISTDEIVDEGDLEETEYESGYLFRTTPPIDDVFGPLVSKFEKYDANEAVVHFYTAVNHEFVKRLLDVYLTYPEVVGEMQVAYEENGHRPYTSNDEWMIIWDRFTAGATINRFDPVD